MNGLSGYRYEPGGGGGGGGPMRTAFGLRAERPDPHEEGDDLGGEAVEGEDAAGDEGSATTGEAPSPQPGED